MWLVLLVVVALTLNVLVLAFERTIELGVFLKICMYFRQRSGPNWAWLLPRREPSPLAKRRRPASEVPGRLGGRPRAGCLVLLDLPRQGQGNPDHHDDHGGRCLGPKGDKF